MLNIGEFSKICAVTTRTLRHYDDIGLITPNMINKENGYRLYDISQIRDMIFIKRLKEYNFSLEEIKEIISTNDNEFMLNKIINKKLQIQNIIKQFNDIEKQITEDITNLKKGVDIMSFIDKIEVKLVETQDMNILNLRQRMNVEEYGYYIGKLFEIVYSNHFKVEGCPMSIYHDSEFNPEDNDTEIALPIKENNKFTRILKGNTCAMTTFVGPYSKLNGAYGKLTEWIEKNKYEFIDAPYEKYIKGPMDGGDIITEIYFPIKKK
ncbi:MerR family transcriptional regulator [Clostridium weizhouense]|uniref:MerR family transcriptional regulator n=1 Tax=Clostridium weizhouense TaxID=2859781 RepID=A0ABS7ALB1_9CLOT|nr:MerR family transcriptional regulator [Clostridium weizhouense]MBW6409439.1 MerR family transcriptional regulator [Clostridium weizhouense]